MSTLTQILIATITAGALSALTASVVLLLRPARLRRLVPHFVSYAIGALLGVAFLGLIPRAMAGMDAEGSHAIGATLVAGILLFFLLEKFVLWRHCHHGDDCEAHGVSEVDHGGKAASGMLVLIGDGLHNLVDGLVIGAAFLTDPRLGVVTTIAVISHEIPQELGDFGVLLDAGFDRTAAFLWNLLAAGAVMVGGVIAYLALAEAQALLPYVLALAAASFIYVAVADLIPGLHRRVNAGATLGQISLILLGLGSVYGSSLLFH